MFNVILKYNLKYKFFGDWKWFVNEYIVYFFDLICCCYIMYFCFVKIYVFLKYKSCCIRGKYFDKFFFDNYLKELLI